jgi:hydrogenase/urease accessory protein HupE
MSVPPSPTSASTKVWLALFVFLFLSGMRAVAHPVAQGSLELRVRPGLVEARFRISNEQVFVASTFGSRGAASATLDELWREHAPYVLAHVQLLADGAALHGEVTGVTPSDDHTVKGFGVYEFRFPLPSPDPHRITVGENLLNEIEFAPGNPWEATFVTRLVQDGRIVREGALLSARQPVEWTLDSNATPSADRPPVLSQSRLAGDYFRHGVWHILGGWDHLLFMSGLVLAVASFWDLVKVVTAFTVAHTVTLTLATLHLVNLPRAFVEPMIAASIVVVAAQNLFTPSQTHGWPRLAIAFGFGLFHGLGFAGGLLEAMAGLPGTAIATAIAAFSVGVETGHQIVVLPLFGMLAFFRRLDSRALHAPSWSPRARCVGSALVLLAGLYYLQLALR